MIYTLQKLLNNIPTGPSLSAFISYWQPSLRTTDSAVLSVAQQAARHLGIA